MKKSSESWWYHIKKTQSKFSWKFQEKPAYSMKNYKNQILQNNTKTDDPAW